MKSNSGFTLIEILVALAIFAVLGMLAAIGLHSVLETHERISKVDHRLQQLEVAFTLMRRDVSQIVARSIINKNGVQEPAVYSRDGDSVSITHLGFINPFAMSPRSNLQRVAYELNKHRLLRLTWSSVDQAPNVKPVKQILLKKINSLRFQFIAENNQKFQVWPIGPESTSPTSRYQKRLPKAIIVTVQLEHWGRIEMVFPIPARGANAIQSF